MKTKPILSEHETALMMAAAVAEAKKHGWPVAISIVDDGGHLLAMTRLDNTAPMNAVFSQEKAKTAAISGFETNLKILWPAAEPFSLRAFGYFSERRPAGVGERPNHRCHRRLRRHRRAGYASGQSRIGRVNQCLMSKNI